MTETKKKCLDMVNQVSSEVLFDTSDAIIHDAHTGFKEDYLVLHSLLRKHRPMSFLEVGTNIGSGLNVICNAIYKYHFDANIYSLDLPFEIKQFNTKQYPYTAKGEDRVGSAATFPYIQLRGDSLYFKFHDYPCEGYWIDGEHDFRHVISETTQVLKVNPKIVIFHDTDVPAVMEAIQVAVAGKPYELYRVTDTRISYLLPQ